MILRTAYLVTPYSPVGALDELPLELNLEDGSHVKLTEEQCDEAKELHLVREFPIKVPLDIEVEQSGWSVELSDGTHAPLPRLRIPDGSGPSHRLLDDLIDGLSFLTDTSVRYRRRGSDLLVSQDQEDAEMIERVGSAEPFSATGLRTAIRTTSLLVDAGNVRRCTATEPSHRSVPRVLASPGVGVRTEGQGARQEPGQIQARERNQVR